MKTYFFLIALLCAFNSQAQCEDFDAEYTLHHPTCNGFTDGAIFATVSGGTFPFIFNLTNEDGDDVETIMGGTDFLLGFGCYFIEIIDSEGCVITDTLKLIDPDLMTVDIIVTPPSESGACDGMVQCDTVFDYQGDYGNIFYYWSPPGEGGIGEHTITDVCEGSYELTINDENGCSVVFDFDVIAFSGIVDNDQNNMQIFVDLGEKEVIITNVAMDKQLFKLISISGQVLMERKLNVGENRLKLNSQSGIYIYQIETAGQITQSGKLKL